MGDIWGDNCAVLRSTISLCLDIALLFESDVISNIFFFTDSL